MSATHPYTTETLRCGCRVDVEADETAHVTTACEGHRRRAYDRPYRLPILRWLLTGDTRP